ncbi:hypothetical protein J2Y48_004819 [Mycoplana sp. BE70]|nr:hypothetical protein [Mycoplana sp. BE70]
MRWTRHFSIVNPWPYILFEVLIDVTSEAGFAGS